MDIGCIFCNSWLVILKVTGFERRFRVCLDEGKGRGGERAKVMIVILHKDIRIASEMFIPSSNLAFPPFKSIRMCLDT